MNLFSAVPASADQKEYDFLIRGAVIFDGESLRSTHGDVGILGDKIAFVGDAPEGVSGREEINAQGLVLAPGFIDAHTHSDFNPLVYPKLPNKLLQGVTTEVTGNCGMSAAPVLGGHGKQIRSVWAREGVEIGSVKWRTYGEYVRRIEKKGMPGNFIGLAGHGNLRSAVMGNAPRAASAGEIAQMKKLLGEAMDEGARGISYGLVYLPGIFANEEELTELCREAAKRFGVCAFHMRNEGSNLIPAIREAINIGRQAQARIQLSHLKAAGRNNWPLIDEAFKMIEEARLDGVKITADAYPYVASYAELGVVLPDDIYSREDRIDLFRNPLQRQALLEKLRAHYEAKAMKWDSVMIASAKGRRWRKYEGKTLLEIARTTGQQPEEFLIDILGSTKFETSAFYFSQSESVVSQVLEKTYVTVGSDSIADGSRKPHPRAYGTFPRIFGEYVRGRKTLELGDAIRKMTSLPADQFGLEDRGRIRQGMAADLVLFDAGEITDRATYSDPSASNLGIRWVFVNGRPAVEKGKWTEKKYGRIL